MGSLVVEAFSRAICLGKEGTQLVQPLAEQEASVSPEDDQESNISIGVPPGPESPRPPLSKLSSMKPSPLLAVHLVDIIYSYCFTLRLYNGDWQPDTIGSAMVVLSVSFVLGQGGLQFGLNLVDDVVSLLSLGGSALIWLLCDPKRLIQQGDRQLKSEKPRKSARAEIKNKLMLAERKVYFIICWVHEQPAEA